MCNQVTGTILVWCAAGGPLTLWKVGPFYFPVLFLWETKSRGVVPAFPKKISPTFPGKESPMTIPGEHPQYELSYYCKPSVDRSQSTLRGPRVALIP